MDTATVGHDLEAHERRALARYIARQWPMLDAEDIVQDVCLAFWAQRQRFDPARPRLPYLYGIARHRVMDRLRALYRGRGRSDDLTEATAATQPHDAVSARHDVGRLLGILPPGQSQAIVAMRLNGMSAVEAAEACGQSVSLVKVNCHRGIKRMRAASGGELNL
ncbi:MAG: sigma-70 family RNA polymerase sigma factor [Sphingomonadaceae bacterium]|nr:sigma-70 family RNA polymerase sigma factor [Sphingomonadaceae bacterium]